MAHPLSTGTTARALGPAGAVGPGHTGSGGPGCGREDPTPHQADHHSILTSVSGSRSSQALPPAGRSGLEQRRLPTKNTLRPAYPPIHRSHPLLSDLILSCPNLTALSSTYLIIPNLNFPATTPSQNISSFTGVSWPPSPKRRWWKPTWLPWWTHTSHNMFEVNITYAAAAPPAFSSEFWPAYLSPSYTPLLLSHNWPPAPECPLIHQ